MSSNIDGVLEFCEWLWGLKPGSPESERINRRTKPCPDFVHNRLGRGEK